MEKWKWYRGLRSYEEKFNDIFSVIEENILNHEPYFGVMDIYEIDLEDNSNFMLLMIVKTMGPFYPYSVGSIVFTFVKS